MGDWAMGRTREGDCDLSGKFPAPHRLMPGCVMKTLVASKWLQHWTFDRCLLKLSSISCPHTQIPDASGRSDAVL